MHDQGLTQKAGSTCSKQPTICVSKPTVGKMLAARVAPPVGAE